MGFFSKTCAKTYLPVVVQTLEIPHLNHVVALMPDETRVEGAYDGYGCVGGADLMGYEWKKIKFVLRDYWAGETYRDLGNSGDELAQGFFMDKKFLYYCIKHGPFKNRAQYVRAFKKYANW